MLTCGMQAHDARAHVPRYVVAHRAGAVVDQEAHEGEQRGGRGSADGDGDGVQGCGGAGGRPGCQE